MLIAIQRTIGTTSISMIFDEDWDLLKVEMCARWDIEKPFDDHLVWECLRDGDIVTYNGDMYQVWSTHRQGEYVEELFQGRHIEVFYE